MGAEPTALAADPRSGMVYVLEGQAVVRVDPIWGHELGRVLLPDMAEVDSANGAIDQLAVSAIDGSVYVIRPRYRSLSMARADQFH